MGKQSILLIDDNEVVLSATKHALEQAGYRVTTHPRAAGSVALLLQEKPDLVLVDVLMPNIAGDTLAAMFVKAQPGGDTIVLLHSTLDAETLKEKASAAGAHGYVQKSGDAFLLVRAIQRWLKQYPSNGRQRAAPPTSSDAPFASGAFRVAARFSTRPPSMPAPEPARADFGSPMPHVLFVAQDISVLSEYGRRVQGLELFAEFALSGTQALRRARAESVLDLIVCHAALSDMAGLDLHARLLEHDPSWRARVVLIASREQAMPADVSTLREPVTAQSLALSIEHALRRTPRLQRTTV